jgi:hypothetical protein
VNRFWEIIIDDDKLTFEITGSSGDVTLLTNNAAEMQSIGMHVRCQTPDISVSKNSLTIDGYKIEEGLYTRLLFQYGQQAKKQLKRR